MEQQDLSFIQEQIGYGFKNPDLLQQAFVRRSYSQENGGEDNEVLEFIGDKVLDLIVVKLLAEKYGFMLRECDDYEAGEDCDEFACEKNESELTGIKKILTQKKTLAERIGVLSLAQYLIMGKGDRLKGADREDSVREDLFEAILGAIAIDCGWDMKTLQSAVEIMLDPDSVLGGDAADNRVSAVHDWFSREYGTYPEFHYDNSSYYDETRLWIASNEIRAGIAREPSPWGINVQKYEQTHFKCWLHLFGKKFVGYGTSKSLARKSLCGLVYDYLEEHDLLHSIKDEIDHPNRNDAISQLEILARRGYFSIPVYEYKQTCDKDGDPVWESTCRIAEQDRSFSAGASSKKEAKKSAAYKMLKYVLNN